MSSRLKKAVAALATAFILSPASSLAAGAEDRTTTTKWKAVAIDQVGGPTVAYSPLPTLNAIKKCIGDGMQNGGLASVFSQQVPVLKNPEAFIAATKLNRPTFETVPNSITGVLVPRPVRQAFAYTTSDATFIEKPVAPEMMRYLGAPFYQIGTKIGADKAPHPVVASTQSGAVAPAEQRATWTASVLMAAMTAITPKSPQLNKAANSIVSMCAKAAAKKEAREPH